MARRVVDKYVGYWHKFQASGRDVADLGAETGNPELDGVGGRVYGHGWAIADTTRWAGGPDPANGRWHLVLGNWSAQSDTLEALETPLFDFAVNEGWEPPPRGRKSADGFTAFKTEVETLLTGMGWPARGIARAFRHFKANEAFAAGETPGAFARRVDSDAPLGMAAE